MSLTIISQSNKEKEEKILKTIYDCIDKKESIIFNSGAGSGKTYSLIESLRHVIKKYGNNLKRHNQKVICITYTNVATEEVKTRLGKTDMVLVSTIHERIWEIIKDYKSQLVEIHKDKIVEEIGKLKQDIDSKKEYERFRELSDDKKEQFKNIMLENKQLFYQNYDKNAADFRDVFKILLNDYYDLLRNINYFKKTVNTIYKIDNYSNCYENMALNKEGYRYVEYNSTYNRDQLHKMRISHDTLLEYGLKMVEKYDLLKQIIIDKYPYIFIDEYQDTNIKVVEIMNYLQNYAIKIHHNIFIGYFGDIAQNIYSDGVGGKIFQIHSNLKPVYKEFNRRSRKEVIDVINKIRNDEIKQISIYSDCVGGSVKFYSGGSINIERFINNHIDEWNVSSKNQLHCLVLTNETVAKYSGFYNIYNVFKETKKYSGINYELLNTELLSNDLSKLGEIPLLLFKIIRFKNNIDYGQVTISEIIPKSLHDKMNLLELRKIIGLLRQNNGNTLGQYVESILATYSQDIKDKYKIVIGQLFDFENVSYEMFKNYLLEKLFPSLLDDDIGEANAVIQKLLDIRMYEYNLWYTYILNKQEGEVIYHTYHGTKGLEFNNVIIIMENAFGKSTNYFNFFFQNYMKSQLLIGKDKNKFEQIKNLLYVSCSRAINNLSILYLDDVSTFKDEIEEIFGKVYSLKTK
ncbi:UvrD-helicase domain-containing protein [Anaerosalibacter sp. Marseille-P3206]|uniref:UvrD-helicase domain-containing protein n=1 Tax=Anaerosalibacter sp. Marseille-P3206 TaxID=1871005 RepID=UPI0009864E0E|nr:UvrD-helicase domain-containing protein [Anaerosalibacter sp. Marseille-P3206]